jgi:hypothetical protein
MNLLKPLYNRKHKQRKSLIKKTISIFWSLFFIIFKGNWNGCCHHSKLHVMLSDVT